LRGIETVFLVGPPAPNVAELEGSFVNEAKQSGVKHIVKLSALGGREAIFPSLHRDSEEKIEASGVARFEFVRIFHRRLDKGRGARCPRHADPIQRHHMVIRLFPNLFQRWSGDFLEHIADQSLAY
jgi:hypothetical protein